MATKLRNEQLAPLDGWIAAQETWTYASADAPTFTFTISGDKTGKYQPGMRIKLTQTTAKYFIITAVSYGAPNTTITVYGGTDYTLANAAITLPFYSMMKAPFGFPLDPTKWTVSVADSTDLNTVGPATDTWYNKIAITIPIGIWRVSYIATFQINKTVAAALYGQTTLSTTNNGSTDTDLECATSSVLASTGIRDTLNTEKVLNISSKTIYYLNFRCRTSADSIYFIGTDGVVIIRAVCSYL